MSPATWDTHDIEDDDPSAPGRPLPTLVSLHFLRSALRRRRVLCILSALLGLLASTAFLFAFPAPHNAKAMLLLAHEASADPTAAALTDVNLLTSRIVTAITIDRLESTMKVEDFIGSLTVEPVSSTLISITLSAPTDAEAVRRLETLTSTYLEFRAEQFSLQSEILVDGMKQRITELQDESSKLTRRIDQLSATGNPGSSELSDVVSQRAQMNGEISELQQSVQDSILGTASVTGSSRVIDPAAAEAGAVKRRIARMMASGLIGGAAVGCGLVLFQAITSDRLRRRFDVATALDVEVSVSVGRISPVSRRWRRFPGLRRLDVRRAAERQRLAHVIAKELPSAGRIGQLAVACIDNADQARFAVAAAAFDLMASGRGVVLIDLSEHGRLNAAVAELMRSELIFRPTVYRPHGIPALASSYADLRHAEYPDQQPSVLAELTEVSLILADLDPSVGANHLTAWNQSVVVVVTSGQSSAERVRTAGDLIRSAGLDLRFAVLLHAHVTDESSGTAVFDRLGTVHQQQGHVQVEQTARKSQGR